jgi:DNA-binding CsgD family transcriptional regulator
MTAPSLRQDRKVITPTERILAAAGAWKLTPRQVDVLRLAVTGDANKSIAAKLGCAEVTVECHMTALFRKAQAENRAQLVSRFWTLWAATRDEASVPVPQRAQAPSRCPPARMAVDERRVTCGA